MVGDPRQRRFSFIVSGCTQVGLMKLIEKEQDYCDLFEFISRRYPIMSFGICQVILDANEII